MLPAEIIRRKRDGQALSAAELVAFAGGLAGGLAGGPAERRWSDAQAGAMAMAMLLKGLSVDETVALTAAMRDSGRVLAWPDAPGA